MKEPRSVEPRPVSEEKRIEGEISKLSETQKELLSELAKIKAAQKELSKKLARLVELNKIEAARLKAAEEKLLDKWPVIGPPKVTSAAGSEDSVQLSWNPPAGNMNVAGYNVYSREKLLNYIKDTSFTHKGLKSGTLYCYRISTVDPDGNESRKTKRACAKTSEPSTKVALAMAPAVEMLSETVAVAASHNNIELSWASTAANAGVSEFNVYRDGEFVESVKGTSFSQENLKPDTSYCYQISAVDANGNESEKGASICTQTPAMPEIEKPNALTLESTGDSIDLSWDSADDASVAGFNVYRDGVFLKSVTGTSFSQSDVDADTSYCYEITAYDAQGNETERTESMCGKAQSEIDETPPSVPGKLVARAVSHDKIELSWGVSRDNLKIEGYNIYMEGGLLRSTEETSVEIRNLTHNTRYCFVVTAYDSATNESSHGLEACEKTPYEDNKRPSLPAGLSISEIGDNQLDLSWGSSSDDVGVTGYNIYKDGVFMKAVASTSAYNVEIEEEDEESCYSISASDEAGNESRRSRQVCVSKKRKGKKSYTGGGTVWTGGLNEFGQLGHGNKDDKFTLVMVNDVKDVTLVVVGVEHTVVLKNDGTVWAWGRNDKGQLGDGTRKNRNSPVWIKGLTNVTDIAAGRSHTIALESDGTVWAWGRNYYGQLGIGGTSGRNKPVKVMGLTNVVDIAAGWYHTVALSSDGTVWTWGWNHRGQLGDLDVKTRSVPEKVAVLSDVELISAGEAHTVVLKSDGTVWAWGDNKYGQIGIGNTLNVSMPIQVNGLSSVESVSAGMHHSVALKTDGTVWAWGRNEYGQGGVKVGTMLLKPTKVEGLNAVKEITSGVNHTVALKYDGTIWAWGWKFNNRYSKKEAVPMQISGLTGIIDIAAGNKFTAAIKGK